MNFQFATPWVLVLLLAVPVLALLPVWAKMTFRPAGLVYADTSLAASRSSSLRLKAKPTLLVIRLLAISLLIAGVARPQTVEGREIVRGEGVDITLALDISGSMASLDFEPDNRLEAAKQVIADFIDERRYDRVGLVVFAREAFAQSPPTVDHRALGALLEDVKLVTDLGIEDGTAIGLGLATAANMLRDSDAKSKLIILLTDGANNSGEIDPQTAAIAIEALGIKVYTVGAGRPGLVPVPQRGPFGERVVQRESDLDEATLQRIADTTGGRYFRAADTDGLRRVYDEIDSLEKSKVEVRVYDRYEELAAWLVIPALALLVLELMLRNTVLRTLP